MNGEVQTILENKLSEAFAPELLNVKNISDAHNVPPNSETHFQVTLVSTRFANESLVHRHRSVNETLKEELSNAIHALTMNLYTPEEWKMVGPEQLAPPPCHNASS